MSFFLLPNSSLSASVSYRLSHVHPPSFFLWLTCLPMLHQSLSLIQCANTDEALLGIPPFFLVNGSTLLLHCHSNHDCKQQIYSITYPTCKYTNIQAKKNERILLCVTILHFSSVSISKQIGRTGCDSVVPVWDLWWLPLCVFVHKMAISLSFSFPCLGENRKALNAVSPAHPSSSNVHFSGQ